MNQITIRNLDDAVVQRRQPEQNLVQILLDGRISRSLLPPRRVQGTKLRDIDRMLQTP